MCCALTTGAGNRYVEPARDANGQVIFPIEFGMLTVYAYRLNFAEF